MIALCDMHIHSVSSHDSSASVLETATECIKKGVFAFAITDHCDIEYYKEQNVFSLTEASFKETTEASELFSDRIKILRGVEIGEAIWSKEYADEILSSFDFDVVIGSVHAVRYKNYTMPYSVIDFSKMSFEDINGYMEKYFDDLFETVKTADFDIMAHLSCPLRYINGKYGLNVDLKRYESKILPLLKHIVDNGIAMEINTSGIGSAYDCFMPENWIIERFKEMGGYLITLGSDAHVSQNAAKDFDKAIAFLQKLGFTGYYYYKNRKAVKCRI